MSHREEQDAARAAKRKRQEEREADDEKRKRLRALVKVEVTKAQLLDILRNESLLPFDAELLVGCEPVHPDALRFVALREIK